MEPIQVKLINVLDTFLDPHINLDLGSTNKLLEYIKNSESASVTINTKIFSSWLQKALESWKINPPPIEVSVFALELCSILCQNQVKFLMLHNMEILDNIAHILYNDQIRSLECIKTAYVKLLNTCLTSKNGLDWLITSSQLWKHILEVDGIDKYDELRHELVKFLFGLCTEVISVNKLFVLNTIQIIINPILNMSNIISAKNYNLTKESEDNWYKIIRPVCNLICKLYDNFLETIKDKMLFNTLLKYNKIFGFEESLYNILKFVNNDNFALDISILIRPIHLLDIFLYANSDSIVDQEYLRKLIEKFTNLLWINMTKGRVEVVLYLCYITFVKRMKFVLPPLNISFNKFNEPQLIDSQLILFVLAPVLTKTYKLLGKSIQNTVDNDENREQFFYTFTSKINNLFMHLAYQWRDLMFQSSNLDDQAALALKYIMKSIPYYSENCGVTIFRCLIYIFSDIVNDLVKRHDTEFTEVSYISLLMDCLISCIQTFDISWKNSVETVDIMSISVNFLQLPFLPEDLIIGSLKLIELSISKWMCPNLALLIDAKDSSIHFVSSLLHRKLLDTNIKIKKSALEVLLTICQSSKSNLPCFQKMLSETELPKFTIEILESEDNYDMKKIILQCLENLTAVSDLWESLVDMKTLQPILIEILKNKEEKEIHSQVINLVTDIYEQEYFLKFSEDDLYNLMCDFKFHEARINISYSIINFWEKVIKRQLQEEEMEDKEFPEVTFSKKLRKIIVFDDYEIKIRLTRVMEVLCRIGCLENLLSYILCNKHPDVQMKARKISEELVKILKKYKIDYQTIEDRSPQHVLSSESNQINNILFLTDIEKITEMLGHNIIQCRNNIPNKILKPKDFFIIMDEIDSIQFNKITDIDSEHELLLDEILSNITDNLH